MHRKFDAEKAIEEILYIAKRLPGPDIYRILKLMYFADKKHLERYGRFVCNDTYIAMNNGPVPSDTYDIIKHVRGDGYHPCIDERALESFKVLPKPSNRVIPLRDADAYLLSESERRCLDESIDEYGALSFDELKRKSHDKAYEAADENDEIPIEAIATTLADGDLLVHYLTKS